MDLNNNDIEQLRKKQIMREKYKEGKKNIIIITCIATTLLFLLILLISLFSGNSSKSGNTANYGEALSIKESAYSFDLYALNSPEIASDNNHVKLNIGIKNNQQNSLSLSVIAMSLTDNDKNSLLTLSHIYYYEDTIATKEISSGEYLQGNLFFSEIDSSSHEYALINQTLIQKITYLKVSLLAKSKNVGGKISLDYKDYYLKLRP